MSARSIEPVRNAAAPPSVINALLRGLIDYAGLFPPAALPMAAAVTNYDSYLKSPWNWILGRFIVPVSRLGEFEKALGASRGDAWRLSGLPGAEVASDIDRIEDFNQRMSGRAVIESVEVKAASAAGVAKLAELIPSRLETYFELSLASARECMAAVAASGRRVKIRTGGETADKFPTPAEVVEFIRLCVAANVPFKATAGLHHPLRSVHRLTYESDSPSAMMHGFLNVFLAAAFLWAGGEPGLAVAVMGETFPAAFEFAEDGVRWREHKIDASEIAKTRESFALSFGSCSFTEPIQDLRAMHLL